jgi:protein TonB
MDKAMKTTAENRETFEEIVFSNRNKEYGAYQIRNEYTKTLSRGLMISVTAILVAIAIPLIAGLYNNGNTGKPDITITVDMDNPNDLKKDEIDPPPPPDDMRKIEEQTRFEAPVVTIDTTNLSSSPFDMDEMNRRGNTFLTTSDTSISSTTEPPKVIEAPEPPKTYTVVSEMPEFPGGEGARLKFLRDHIVYPRDARELGITGTVYISFVVDEKGHIVDLGIARGIGGGCEGEALRVTSIMPTWTPGKQGGIAVRVHFTMAVKFELN